jgi:hypothetical protein
MYPRVIGITGHYSFPDPKTLGERILDHKRKSGLSLKRMAKLLDFEEAMLTNRKHGMVPQVEIFLCAIV